ncbi:MAG: ABC transporter ATP-binding protein [Planctomycetota bacterium]
MSDATSPAAPPRPSRSTRGRLSSVRRLFPYYRPFVGSVVVMIVATVIASSAEGGQALLLKPLMNRVILGGSDETAERDDQALLTEVGPAAQDALRAELEPTLEALPPVQDPVELQRFAGRTVPAAWGEDAVCQVVDRTRRVLLDVHSKLRPDAPPPDGLQEWLQAPDPEQERLAAEELARALAWQRAAEAALGEDPLAAAPGARTRALVATLEARKIGRGANLTSALGVLWRVVLVAMVLAVTLGLCRYASSALSRVIVVRIYRDMQNAVVQKLLELNAGQLVGRNRGDLLTRITTDLNRTVNGVVLPLTSVVLLQPLRLVALFCVAVYLSWQLSLALVFLAALVVYPIQRWGKLIRRSARTRQGALSDVLESLHQMFAGMREIKGFVREDHERERFRERTQRAYAAEVAVAKARVASRTSLRLLNEITIPVIMVVGGIIVTQRWLGLDAGQFVAFSMLIVMMYRPTRTLASAYNTLQDNLPSLDRAWEVFDLTPVIQDAPDAAELEPIREALRFEGVSFAYDEANPVLQDVSFTAPVGSTTAFVGHTGSGKSTLLDVLARFLEPQAGAVTVDGVDLRQVSQASWQRQLALVSQQNFLFNASVGENIRYGRLDATQEEIEAAAKQAGIHDEIVEQEEGYQRSVGELGSRLSGGQRQRVAIARAIVRQAPVLLLDEATSALDARTEQAVQEALTALSETRTTFVIAHRLSTVRHADQILVLDGGRVVERGTHSELLAAGGRYADLVRQFDDGDARG